MEHNPEIGAMFSRIDRRCVFGFPHFISAVLRQKVQITVGLAIAELKIITQFR